MLYQFEQDGATAPVGKGLAMGWACAAMVTWVTSEVAMGFGVGGFFILAAKAASVLFKRDDDDESLKTGENA